MGRIFRPLSYANIVATLALFLAIGGGGAFAVAATTTDHHRQSDSSNPEPWPPWPRGPHGPQGPKGHKARKATPEPPEPAGAPSPKRPTQRRSAFPDSRCERAVDGRKNVKGCQPGPQHGLLCRCSRSTVVERRAAMSTTHGAGPTTCVPRSPVTLAVATRCSPPRVGSQIEINIGENGSGDFTD